MATRTLPFEYSFRWRDAANLFDPALTDALVVFLEERDRELENFLADLEARVP